MGFHQNRFNRVVVINIIAVVLSCVIAPSAYGAMVKTLVKADCGFKYFKVEDPEGHSSKLLYLTLRGDTILSGLYSNAYFIDNPTAKVGFFTIGYPIQKVIDIEGNVIPVDPKLELSEIRVKSAKNGAVYFLIRRKNFKYGVADINWNVIKRPEYKEAPKYDEHKNEFYFEKNNNKRKYLGFGLPDLDYRSITASMREKIRKSMQIPKDTVFVDHNDDIFWREVRAGRFCGVVNSIGVDIIPLNRHYELIEFTPLKDGLGCFRVQRGSYVGICDLRGKEIVPVSEGYNQVTYYKGYNHEKSGLPGFFKLKKKFQTEIRDITGTVVLPLEDGSVSFNGVDGHVGYFERYSYDCRKFYDMSGSVITLPVSPKETGKVGYDKIFGFGIRDKNYRIKNGFGIFLDKNGMADYSVQEARAREKEEKRRRRSEFWNNLGTAFLQATAATLQAASNSMASGYSSYAPAMSTPTYPSVAAQVSDPQYFNQVNQQLMALSMAQVQQQEMNQYNQARQAYLQRGKDLSLTEFRMMQGAALQQLKDEGIDLVAEQRERNRESSREWRETIATEAKTKQQQLRDYNNARYGGTSSSSSAASASSTSIRNNTAASGSAYNKPKPSSTTGSSRSTNTSTAKTNSSHNAHEQFSAGNKNVNSSEYGDKIRDVSLYLKDGSGYRRASQSGELYKKGASHYVKIGSTFYLVQGSGQNQHIMFGAMPYYLRN